MSSTGVATVQVDLNDIRPSAARTDRGRLGNHEALSDSIGILHSTLRALFYHLTLNLIPSEPEGPSEGLSPHHGRRADEPIIEEAKMLEQGANDASEALSQERPAKPVVLQEGNAEESLGGTF